ncbi:MAG: hypothetical protein ABSG30_06260 [Steroidobacteraceae bacterium]
MRFHRLSKLLLVLLLAASLPLRVYAASCESPATHADYAAAHHGTHCEHGSLSTHGAACDCCCMAVAAASSIWALPHDPPSAVIARLLGHSPVLTLDRLDRPPRPAA